MDRITSNEAKGLMEAYNAVYAPQQEEVVEEVEQIDEAGMDMTKTSAYQNAQTKAATKFYTTPIKPLAPYQAKTPRFPAVTVPDFGLGTNKPKSPSIQQRTPAPAKPAAPASERPAPAPARPAAPAAKTTPSINKPSPAPVIKDGSKPPATPALAPAPTSTPPKPAGGEVAMSKIGDKTDYSVAATKLMSDRTKTILGTKDSQTGNVMRKPQFGAQSARERMLNQDLDLFDIIKGHLLDEGYADTEEAALAIMANMSEEWKKSILES